MSVIDTTRAASTTAGSGTDSSTQQQRNQSAQNALATKDTFLQLLVAQMRNQDPLQPTDSVQFLSQLAQFSNLEQSVQLNEGVANIQKSIDHLTTVVQNSQSTTGDTKP